MDVISYLFSLLLSNLYSPGRIQSYPHLHLIHFKIDMFVWDALSPCIQMKLCSHVHVVKSEAFAEMMERKWCITSKPNSCHVILQYSLLMNLFCRIPGEEPWHVQHRFDTADTDGQQQVPQVFVLTGCCHGETAENSLIVQPFCTSERCLSMLWRCCYV